jgi:hypothetical protein
VLILCFHVHWRRLAAEEDLERPGRDDQTGQLRRWATARNSTEAHFELTEHRALSAGEADVGGENELTAGAAGAGSSV